ncbi:hypothetical protein [Paenibacillus cucumis (ex Kampfer et al. 2016)]|uniref:Uncharacterized protein n=1 Tax=Paenibacillus cucumis (ex Kampfer et al. 2016) TaxID=1776858 RepID=A0ABS7KM75_9BACL|nr:hypothetical protein [Paenibacillus cucumis (ex Kampfer et al. 2016)]MBY0205285.1 hypothetical protein [Paenibacillus cucumis (ex Kampfer et al. 2016)]
MSKQEEIKQALAAATPGPWKVYRSKLGKHEETLIGTEYDHPQLKAPDSIVGHAFGVGVEYTYIREADADLIAKAPEYIAYLLTMLEDLSAIHAFTRQERIEADETVDRLRKELEEYRTLIEQQSAEMNRLQQLVNKQGKELEEKEIILTGRKYTINRLKEQNEEIATVGIRQGEQIARLLQSEKKQYKELEEARKVLKEIAEHGGVNIRGASCAELARAYLGQEGEGNQDIKKAPTQDA